MNRIFQASINCCFPRIVHAESELWCTTLGGPREDLGDALARSSSSINAMASWPAVFRSASVPVRFLLFQRRLLRLVRVSGCFLRCCGRYILRAARCAMGPPANGRWYEYAIFFVPGLPRGWGSVRLDRQVSVWLGIDGIMMEGVGNVVSCQRRCDQNRYALVFNSRLHTDSPRRL